MKTLTSILLIAAFSLGSLLSQVPVKEVDGSGSERFTAAAGKAFVIDLYTITNSSVSQTTSNVWIQSWQCTNTTGTAATLTIENTAGTDFVSALSIPATGVASANYNARGLRLVGLKWFSGTSSALNCTLAGVTE